MVTTEVEVEDFLLPEVEMEDFLLLEVEVEDSLLLEVVAVVEEVFLLLAMEIAETKDTYPLWGYPPETGIYPHQEEGVIIPRDQAVQVGHKRCTETCLHQLKPN